MAYLLDTNVVSNLIRDPDGPVAGRLEGMHRSVVFTSVIVAAELRHGAIRRGSADLTRRVEAALNSFTVLPLEPPADEVYASIRHGLERGGQLIGANDLLIAAHALALEYILVTDNTREFLRMPGLTVKNWIRA